MDGSLSQSFFPGGALIGCEAGTLNTPKIKGSHTVNEKSMIGAEEVFKELSNGKENTELINFQDEFKKSWAGAGAQKNVEILDHPLNLD